MEQIKWIRRLIPEEREQMRLKPLGKVKLVAEKVWYNGDPMYLVKHVKATKAEDLPYSYLSGDPVCYLDGSALVLHYIDDELKEMTTVYIEPGNMYGKDEYEKYLNYIKKAGERLADILANNVILLDRGWKGVHVAKI